MFINCLILAFFIVEFPAVLLDTSSGKILDSFQQYVKPTEHKTLSTFCKDLTGISQVSVYLDVINSKYHCACVIVFILVTSFRHYFHSVEVYKTNVVFMLK